MGNNYVPSTSLFPSITGAAFGMDASLALVERTKMGNRWMESLRNNVWIQVAVPDRKWVPRYGQLVPNEILQALWPEDFRGRLGIQVGFRDVLDSLKELLKILDTRRGFRRSRRERGSTSCGHEVSVEVGESMKWLKDA